MSNDERESPRKAIRNWLLHTNNERIARTSEDEDRDDKGLGEHDPPRRPTRHRGSVNADTNKRNRKNDATPLQILKDNDSAKPLKHVEHDRSLADRLSLQAPFRTFGNDVDQDVIGPDGGPRRRKRRFSLSSEISYLEPAVFLRSSRHRNYRHHEPRERCGARRKIDYSGTRSNSGSDSSQASSITLTSPEKPVKTYERRSRHKTKEDRYDLKQPKTGRKVKKKHEEGNKKKKKSKRKEKPAVVVMHSFSAPNVAPDRLTMRPSATLGLFGKGRTSSPIRRRGLPDLAFSEMTFLNTRREKPGDQVKVTQNTMRRKKDKRADTEAEISRYFTSISIPRLEKAHNRNERIERFLGSNATKCKAQCHADRPPSPNLSTLPPIDLPGRPFLGFGSRREDLTSPVQEYRHKEQPKHRAITPPIASTPGRSTSYFSWSESAASNVRRRSDVSEAASTDLGNTPNIPQRAVEPVDTPQHISKSLVGHQLNGNGPTIRSHTSDIAISPIDDTQAYITRNSESQDLQLEGVRKVATEEGKQTCLTPSDPKAEVSRDVRHSRPPSDQIQKAVITDLDGVQVDIRVTTGVTRSIRPLDPFEAAFEGLLQSCRPYVEEMSHPVNSERRNSSHATPMQPYGSDFVAQRQSTSDHRQSQSHLKGTLVRPSSYGPHAGIANMKGPFPPSSIEDAGKASKRLIDTNHSTIERATSNTCHLDWPCSDQKFAEPIHHLGMSGTDSNNAWQGYDAMYERQIQAPTPGYTGRYHDGPLATHELAWPADLTATGLSHDFESHAGEQHDECSNSDYPEDYQGLSKYGFLDQESHEPLYPGMEDSLIDDAGSLLPQEFLELIKAGPNRMQYTSPLMDMDTLEEQPDIWENQEGLNVPSFRTPFRADRGIQATPQVGDRSLSWRTPGTTRSDDHQFPVLMRATVDKREGDTSMEGFWRPNKLY